jgi:hypothetical protein
VPARPLAIAGNAHFAIGGVRVFVGVIGERVAWPGVAVARFLPRRPIPGDAVAHPGSGAAQPFQPGQRLQLQQMVQNRVGQRRTARITAVCQHHDPAAMVGQQPQIAIVAEPAAAVVDTPGAAVVYDPETEAVMHRTDLGEFRAADMDLRGRQIRSRARRQSQRAAARHRVELEVHIGCHVRDRRADTAARPRVDRPH